MTRRIQNVPIRGGFWLIVRLSASILPARALFMGRTAQKVIIHHADRLHESVDDFCPDK